MGEFDLAPDRRERILSFVQTNGSVRVRDIAKKFKVSEMTVRRDIKQLADEGTIERIHGGARTPKNNVSHELSPSQKELLNPEIKALIGAKAVSQITAESVVGIGSGTTCLAFSRQLCARDDLTIVTISVAVANTFWSNSKSRVLLVGGELTKSLTLAGPIALQALENLHLDITVLGSHGFDSSEGFTCPNLLEAQINRKLLSISDRAMVVADADKWGVVGLTTFAQLKDIDVLVSDDRLPNVAKEALVDNGVEILLS